MPIHRGIYAYSQHDGRPCWQAPDLRYAGATAEGIYAVPPNATKAEGKLLDPATGQVLREEAVDGAAIDRWQNQQYAPLHFPDMVNEQTGDLAGYAQLVARTTGHQPYGQIEHWSWGEEPVLQALSYYIQREDNKLDNRIAVLYNGQLAYDELMLSAADGFGIDTFFLYHQTLIYVHEQQTLHLLPLNA